LVVAAAGGLESARPAQPGELIVPTALACRNLTYAYPNGEPSATPPLLRNIDAVFPGGRVVLISGKSGAGKSTLLHLLAGLLRPTSGEILADGQPVSRWLTAHRDRWRRQVGIVFQQDHLVSELTVLENVMLPLIPRSGSPRYWRESSHDILARLNAGELVGQSVSTLSGGQRQRVATARALVDAPDYILADEPTAHQDLENAQRLGHLLRQAAEGGAVVVVAAHDRHVDEWLKVDQHLSLADGNLEPAP
jgi:ABC-type lipoprotein export system ATPase subunit